MGYWRFPRYVSVAEKRAKAEKKLKQLKKKNPDIQPVVIQGRAIAKTWWGKSWNDNLERYADFANRIGRGRSYVRHRAVLDLRIDPGKVAAVVQGSRSRPYNVEIHIKAMGKKTWTDIKKACTDKFDSLQALLAGKFPKSLSDIFTARGKGLFPSPSDIDLNCSCPDWAKMCKHVAATLYGIGARLDEDPSLFFTLRKVQVMDLVTEAMEETTDLLLKKAAKKRDGVITDADLEGVFGIEMEDVTGFSRVDLPKPKRSGRQGRRTARQQQSGAAANKKKIIVRAGRGLYKGKDAPIDPSKEAQTVLALIQKSKKGIGVAEIKRITHIPDARVRYIVSRAYARADIIRVARGVYAGAKKNAVPLNATDAVLKIIKRSHNGIGFSLLREKSGLNEKKLRNIIFRLNKLNKIKRVGRGVYAATRNR